MAVAVDAFILLSSAELATLRTKAVAELNAQIIAGQSWTRQGSHQKTGIDFEKLTETIRALDYAIKLKGGTIVLDTVADMSGTHR